MCTGGNAQLFSCPQGERESICPLRARVEVLRAEAGRMGGAQRLWRLSAEAKRPTVRGIRVHSPSRHANLEAHSSRRK